MQEPSWSGRRHVCGGRSPTESEESSPIRFQARIAAGSAAAQLLNCDNAARTRAFVAILSVGSMTGANCDEWLDGASVFTVPASAAYLYLSASLDPII
ncbi:hypothetical protein BSP239C_01916 [Brevibacterium sp. 239c]|nr:hypothetical protein BSP239C_01916 [Brevibacterium sp. 239c]